ncbi:MAG TPA: trypsin-like serine peptidase [Xylella sp.]
MNGIKLTPFSLFFFMSIAVAHGVDELSSGGAISLGPRSFLEMEADEKYWTDERMAAAQPLPMPVISSEEFSRIDAEARFKSSLGKNEKRIVILPSSPVDEAVGDEFLPAIKTQVGVPEEADVNQRPFWNAGKLFFKDPDGKDSNCTAEFVGSNQILMTAAHCLNDGKGNWNTNIVFSPRYRGKDRFKVSGTSCTVVPAIWNGKNYQKDYGFVVANRLGPGWLGLKTGIPYSSWTAIGYPKNYGNAQYLQRVDGFKAPHDPMIIGAIVGMQNNPMQYGASGGAWIGDLNTGGQAGGNYAIGLNSFIMNNRPYIMYGPYFDNDFISIYNQVKQLCNLK